MIMFRTSRERWVVNALPGFLCANWKKGESLHILAPKTCVASEIHEKSFMAIIHRYDHGPPPKKLLGSFNKFEKY